MFWWTPKKRERDWHLDTEVKLEAKFSKIPSKQYYRFTQAKPGFPLHAEQD